MSKYKISQQGIEELKQSEALRLDAYPDVKGVWTIGYGHTGTVNGKPIHKGMKISNEQAEQLLRADLEHFEKTINHNVKVPLNQGQYDSLVSLAFNIGSKNFKESTLLRRLNAGDYEAAADQFLVWNKSGGKFVQGLLNRRERERAGFLGSKEPISQTIPMPTNVDEPIDAPLKTPSQKFDQDTANAFSFQPEIAQAQELTPWAHDIVSSTEPFNEPMNAFPEPPKPDYSAQLAQAFGIPPQGANDGLGDYVSSLVESIYNEVE